MSADSKTNLNSPGAGLDAASMRSLVTELSRAKSRQDIDSAMRAYHPEAELLCPPFQSRRVGQLAILHGTRNFFAFAPDYASDLSGMANFNETLCAWGEIRFTPAFTFRGERPNGKTVRSPVFILFRFREGRIVWESFHFDLADVARQAGVPMEAFIAPRAQAATAGD